MKFRLISGRHSIRAANGDGDFVVERYKAGDRIISNDDLEAKFPGRFERIGRKRNVQDAQDAQNEADSDQNGDKSNDEGIDDSEDDQDVISDSDESSEIMLEPVHRGGGRWDVIKVVDGIESDECVNDVFLDKDEAKALAAAGWPIDKNDE